MAPDKKRYSMIKGVITIALLITPLTLLCEGESPTAPAQDSQPEQASGNYVKARRRIRAIHAVGNKSVPTEALLNYIPYRIGELITVQSTGQIERSAQLIRNLYTNLKRFRNITVWADLVEPDEIDLYIAVQEKTPLIDTIFSGNKHLPEAEIRKKINLDIPAIDEEELKAIAEQIKKLYYEKGFQNVTITTALNVNKDGYGVAEFTFDEGQKSRIRRIRSDGNQ